ncbi:MAG: helix-turn-helix domain-containing protein [Clostridia bacterium]|nr:helix-turn-helix domain-containing protein [Clostridia bacterium]
MKLSEKLLLLRKQHNLSQEDLANQLFITRQSVSLWEKGKAVPSLDNLIMLKKIYGISIDEWVCENDSETEARDAYPATEKVMSIPLRHTWKRKTILLICALTLCLAIITVGIFNLVSRYKTLYTYGKHDDSYVCKEMINVNYKGVATVIYDEANKPLITGLIPNDYVKSDSIDGLYTSSDRKGEFIRFTSEYKENVPNIITGCDGYKYLSEIGITSVMAMSRFALSYDLDKVSVFSSRKDIEIASAVRRIRAVLYDADANSADVINYHFVYGEMDGYALNMDNGVWIITLQDQKDNYCNITIKAPEGIGQSADTVTEFLSTIGLCCNNQ